MCACAAARRGLSTRCVGSVVRALQARGMVRSHTDGIVGPVGGVAVYAGFDPTGPGLHVGHLVVLNALQVCAAEGMSVVALVSGGLCIYVRAYVCMYVVMVCMYVCMYVLVHVRQYVCMSVCV